MDQVIIYRHLVENWVTNAWFVVIQADDAVWLFIKMPKEFSYGIGIDFINTCCYAFYRMMSYPLFLPPCKDVLNSRASLLYSFFKSGQIEL